MECTTNHMPFIMGMSLIFLSFVGCMLYDNWSSKDSCTTGAEQNIGLVTPGRVKNFPLNKDERFSVCSEAKKQ